MKAYTHFYAGGAWTASVASAWYKGNGLRPPKGYTKMYPSKPVKSNSRDTQKFRKKRAEWKASLNKKKSR